MRSVDVLLLLCARFHLCDSAGVVPTDWTKGKTNISTSRSTSALRAQTFVDVVTEGYWRFESILPSAFWRAEGILADHSGHDNHLSWSEGSDEVAIETAVQYGRAIDSVPRDIDCKSDVGLGCTWLEEAGYFQNKKRRSPEWNGSSFSTGSFQMSHNIAPYSLFNSANAKQSFLARKIHDIYTREDHTNQPGGGNYSFDPGVLDTKERGVLYFDHTRKESPFNFSSDFTVEAFFTTNRDVSDQGVMHVLYQAAVKNTEVDNDEFTFRISLNTRGPGTLEFALSKPSDPNVVSSVYPSNVTAAGGSNYADGSWHYVVARYNHEATGGGSDGYLSIKVLNSKDSSLDFAQAIVPASHQLDSRPGYLFFGSAGPASSGTQYQFDGQIDEVRISAGLVSESELLGDTLHATPGGMVGPGCASQTKFTHRRHKFTDGSDAGFEYLNNQFCEWLVQPDAAQVSSAFLVLRFRRFSTEPNDDIVRIYDGNTTTAPILTVLSGYNVPDSPIVSSSGSVLIQFVTDGKHITAQHGWKIEYETLSMRQQICGTASEGKTMELQCPEGYTIKKINFASYGTPRGFCSTTALGTGELKDVTGYTYSDTSNPNATVRSGFPESGVSGDSYGPTNYNIGYCHSDKSGEVVRTACLDRNSCSIEAIDTTFDGDPCADFSDSQLGIFTSDNITVAGSDTVPSTEGPYHGGTSKRLYVEATCEGFDTYTNNCAEQCSDNEKCVYGLTHEFCGHCSLDMLGMVATVDGGYTSQGCGKQFCVAESACESLPPKAPREVALYVDATVDSKSSINVTWMSPAAGFVFNYKIEHNVAEMFDGGEGAAVVIDGPPVHGLNMSYTIPNLVLGRRYWVRVAGRNHKGYGPYMVSPSFITPSLAPLPPAVITAKTLVAKKGSALIVFPEVPCADPETDDCRGIAVSKYKIEWSETNSFESVFTKVLVGAGAGNLDFAAYSEVLADNFTTANDLQWVTSGGAISDVCGAATTGGNTALVFSADGLRYGMTNDLDLTLATTLTFKLKYGNSIDGYPSCGEMENAEQEVVLEYSLDKGLTWTEIDKFNYGMYGDFADSSTDVSINLPSTAQVFGSRLRWVQQSHKGKDKNVWALDDVQIKLNQALATTVSDLATGVSYHFRLSAFSDRVSESGYGAFVQPHPTFITPASPPDPATTVKMVVENTTSLIVNWTQIVCDVPTTDPCNGVQATKYKIEWDTSANFLSGTSNFTEVVHVAEQAENGVTISGLLTGVAYYIRVFSYNPEGYSLTFTMAAAATASTDYLKPADPPLPPKNVKLFPVSPNAVRIEFEGVPCTHPLTDDCNGQPVDSYKVEWSSTLDFVELQSAVISADQLAYGIDGLTTGFPYYIRVRAHNLEGYGVGGYSSPAFVIPATQPGPPGDMNVSHSAKDSLTVTVAKIPCDEPFSDYCNGREVTDYKVQWDTFDSFEAGDVGFGEAEVVAADFDGDTVSFTITGLTTGTPYFVRAAGKNSEGWGSYINFVGFAVASGQPGGVFHLKDTFEGADDWSTRSTSFMSELGTYRSPMIVSSVQAFNGGGGGNTSGGGAGPGYSALMQSETAGGDYFQGAIGAEFNTLNFPYLCTAFRAQPGANVDLLPRVSTDPFWHSVSVTGNLGAHGKPKVATWNLSADVSWHHQCLDLHSALSSAVGGDQATSGYTVQSLPFFVDGTARIDDFSISSVPAQATIVAAAVSDAPANTALAYHPSLGTSLVVTWNLVSCDDLASDACNGRVVSKYKVEWSDSSTFDSISDSEVVDGALSTYSIDGLTTGTQYFVRVLAYNFQGYSSPAITTPASLAPAAPPDAPTSTKVSRLSKTALLVEFANVICVDPTVDPCNGEPVDEYLLEWSTTAEFDADLGSGKVESPPVAGNSQFTITGLATGVPYYVRILGHNIQGDSLYYGYPSPRHTIPSDVPATPPGLAVTVASRTSLKTHFDTPLNDWGATVDKFTVQWSQAADFNPLVGERNVSFEPNVRLVDSFNPIAGSLWSSRSGDATSGVCGSSDGDSQALVFGGSGTRQAATKAMDLTSGGNVTFFIKYGKPESEDAFPGCKGSITTGEQIAFEYSIDGGSTWVAIPDAISSSSTIFTAFTYVKVQIPPAAATSSTTFRFVQASHSGENKDMWALDEVRVVSPDGLQYTIPSLATSVSYYVRVLAHNAIGYSDPLTDSSFVQPAGQADGPANVSVSIYSTTQLRVAWTPVQCCDVQNASGEPKCLSYDPSFEDTVPTCNGQPVRKYRVQWNMAQGFDGKGGLAELEYRLGWAPGKAEGNKMSYIINGIQTGTAYYVRVQAENVEGWGLYSMPDPGFSTPSGTPDDASQVLLTTEPMSMTKLVAHIHPPATDNGMPITKYTVKWATDEGGVNSTVLDYPVYNGDYPGVGSGTGQGTNPVSFSGEGHTVNTAVAASPSVYTNATVGEGGTLYTDAGSAGLVVFLAPMYQVFTYTGAEHKVVVPNDVYFVHIRAWGGGGGGGGGGGAFVEAKYSVNPGDALFVRVGGGGRPSSGATGGAGGKFGGGRGGDGDPEGGGSGGGGGGGSSTVTLTRRADVDIAWDLESSDATNFLLACAAGGGGGGATSKGKTKGVVLGGAGNVLNNATDGVTDGTPDQGYGAGGAAGATSVAGASAGVGATDGSKTAEATAGTNSGGGDGGSGLNGGGGGGGCGDLSGGGGATLSGGGGGGGGRHGGGGGGGMSFVAPGRESTKIVIENLITGQPYWIQVQGVNKLGGGDWAMASPAYAIPANVPDPPPAVEAFVLYDETHVDGRSMRVDWQAAVPNGREVDYYLVELSREETFATLERQEQVVASLGVDGKYSLEIGNLVVGVPLYSRVGAHNYEGLSQYENSALDYTCPPTVAPCAFKTPAYPPQPPTYASLNVPTAKSLRVFFPEVMCENATTDACNGLAQRTVKVEWTRTGFPDVEGTAVHNITGLKDNVTLIIPQLETGDQYFVRLSISNSIGYGPYLETTPKSAVPAGDGLTAAKAAQSCKLIKDNFASSGTGVYWLNPSKVTPFQGYCDMDTKVGDEGSGWTLVTKLRDVGDSLDNHLSNKFSGATWYSDNATSLTAVDSSFTPLANKTLLPFTQDDTLWGSYDAGLFTKFTQIMVFPGKMEDRVDNDDYYIFNMNHDGWTNFPAEVTQVSSCVKKRIANEVQDCAAGEYLSYMGNNKDENYYLTSSCAIDDRQAPITKYQSLCIRTKFTPTLYLGYNFVSMDDAGTIRETCKFFGSSCKNFHGRRFEVWVK